MDSVHNFRKTSLVKNYLQYFFNMYIKIFIDCIINLDKILITRIHFKLGPVLVQGEVVIVHVSY